MITGAIRTPLLTAFYALVGVAVGWVWFKAPFPAGGIAGVVVALLALLTWIAALVVWWGDKSVTTAPNRARRLYESHSLIVGLVAAAASGLAIVASITLSGMASADPDKTLLGTVSTALTALVAGLFVSVKESDEALGTFIAKRFRARFYQRKGKTAEQLAAEQAAGNIELPYESPPLLAVHDLDGDWTRSGRKEAVETVDAYLRWLSRSQNSAPAWNPEWGEQPDAT